MNNFPPRSTHEQEIQALLNILSSVIEPGEAAYMSAPITSGRRFSDWWRKRNGDIEMSRPAHREEFQREVVSRNRAHARQIIEQLRRVLDCTLIDPTAVEDMPGWMQDDYRAFWACVVEKYVGKVVLIEGWAYSNGCSYEFLIAQRKRIPTLDERQQPISLAEGVRLIQWAIAEMNQQALETAFLECVVEELNKLRSSEMKELCTT